MKKINYRVFIIVIILVLVLTSCDHTKLSGEIVFKDSLIEVGKTHVVLLEVPVELEEIYRVMWIVTPSEKGEIIEGEEILETLNDDQLQLYFGQIDNLNVDRIALFIPKEVGKCTIEASGFYKQTNPQLITKITIEIVK